MTYECYLEVFLSVCPTYNMKIVQKKRISEENPNTNSGATYTDGYSVQEIDMDISNIMDTANITCRYW